MLLILGCGCKEYNYAGLVGVLLLWKLSLVHLSGWKAISQSASHHAAESRSCWSLRQSSCALISLNDAVVCKKSYVCHFKPVYFAFIQVFNIFPVKIHRQKNAHIVDTIQLIILKLCFLLLTRMFCLLMAPKQSRYCNHPGIHIDYSHKCLISKQYL